MGLFEIAALVDFVGLAAVPVVVLAAPALVAVASPVISEAILVITPVAVVAVTVLVVSEELELDEPPPSTVVPFEPNRLNSATVEP